MVMFALISNSCSFLLLSGFACNYGSLSVHQFRFGHAISSKDSCVKGLVPTGYPSWEAFGFWELWSYQWIKWPYWKVGTSWPKATEPVNHDLKHLKPWPRINPSSFKLLFCWYFVTVMKTHTWGLVRWLVTKMEDPSSIMKERAVPSKSPSDHMHHGIHALAHTISPSINKLTLEKDGSPLTLGYELSLVFGNH